MCPTGRGALNPSLMSSNLVVLSFCFFVLCSETEIKKRRCPYSFFPLSSHIYLTVASAALFSLKALSTRHLQSEPNAPEGGDFSLLRVLVNPPVDVRIRLDHNKQMEDVGALRFMWFINLDNPLLIEADSVVLSSPQLLDINLQHSFRPSPNPLRPDPVSWSLACPEEHHYPSPRPTSVLLAPHRVPFGLLFSRFQPLKILS